MLLRRLSASLSLLVAFASGLHAQVAPSKTSSVEGDVYLTLRNGQLSKIAASTVRIVAVDSLTAAKGRCGPSNPADYKAMEREQAAFSATLQAGAVRSAPTGMQAHYRLDSIPAGNYVLWTETPLGAAGYHWLVPVSVKAGQTLTVDLDNTNAALGTFYCVIT